MGPKPGPGARCESDAPPIARYCAPGGGPKVVGGGPNEPVLGAGPK
ncbi:MAG: hypothetical protein H2042_14215, partial [Rhizobiales bacterium]|nr:hypothetical protein [Hyphomicrobiales bacterium]